MQRAIFKGRLSYNDLAKERLKNIKGDSVFLDINNIDPNSQNETSNGRTFQYIELQIPDTLYLDTIKIEGESLLVPLGLNNYEWHEDVTVSDYSFAPKIHLKECRLLLPAKNKEASHLPVLGWMLYQDVLGFVLSNFRVVFFGKGVIL